jgi:hypothetical protein
VLERRSNTGWAISRLTKMHLNLKCSVKQLMAHPVCGSGHAITLRYIYAYVVRCIVTGC